MTSWISNFFRLFWRVWFYILVTLPILIFFPILFALTLSEKTYHQFYWVARNLWAQPILYGMGLAPKIKRATKLQPNKSYMLVANHTSMIDIMLMMKLSKNPFVFVGKKELVKIPLFGFFYKRVCIMVDRSNPKSRTAVYLRAQRRLKSGLSICIFPEGGVPDDETVILDSFKDGAFKMAIAHQIPIAAFTLLDCKKRFPFTFFAGKPGILRSYQHKIISTKGLTNNDYKNLKEQTRNLILEKLQQNKL